MARAAWRRLWVVIVAGIPPGVLIVGVGGRLAMLLLRVTSPDSVRAVTSDDGFVIGQVTLGGTYNFLLAGAAAGVLAAVVYTWVAPWLVGPLWLRRATAAVAAGVVIGPFVIHPGGVDFTLLQPRWLAIALFVVIPAAIALAVGATVDAARVKAERGLGRRDALLAAALVLCFPLVLSVLAPTALVILAWSAVRERTAFEALRSRSAVVLAVRAVWVLVALGGLRALVEDVRAIL